MSVKPGQAHSSAMDLAAALDAEATPVEIAQVAEAAESLAGYGELRARGFTHAECMEMLDAGVKHFSDVNAALEQGANIDECLEVAKSGQSVAAYSRCRHHAASHQQCREAIDSGLGLDWYSELREKRVPHKECVKAAGIVAGQTAVGYARCRHEGATHAECMEVVAGGGDLAGYGAPRRAGSSHAECVEVVDLGVDLRW